MKKLTFDETVRVAVNSVSEGLIDRVTAINMINKAADELVNYLECSLAAALMTLERAVDDYKKSNELYPLDEMTTDEAIDLYIADEMLLHCRDGHAVAMFKEMSEPLAG
jgi:hypothetical protein